MVQKKLNSMALVLSDEAVSICPTPSHYDQGQPSIWPLSFVLFSMGDPTRNFLANTVFQVIKIYRLPHHITVVTQEKKYTHTSNTK
jgi:hypothetical protein